MKSDARNAAPEMPIIVCQMTATLCANASCTLERNGSSSVGMSGMSEYASETPPGSSARNASGRRFSSCVCRIAVPMVMPQTYKEITGK